MDEVEIREYRRLAKREGVTLAEWVRQKLRRAKREEPSVAAARKLDAIRAATAHAFPTADIDRMLEEIEAGYRT